jgi:hypothetical protein
MLRKVNLVALNVLSHTSRTPLIANLITRKRIEPQSRRFAGKTRKRPDSTILGITLCLLAVLFAICAAPADLIPVRAQNVPPTASTCCGKKPPGFPDLKATTTTAAQTYSTFSGQIAVVTGQLKGGSSVVVVDLKNENGGVAVDKNWDSSSSPPTQLYRHPDWSVTKIGDVFGLTLDNQGNVYVTATTSYFTKAPLTTANPGRVYRIDGTSGAVNVFATLPNKGPALGNINYSCAYDSFYVSNFADGRIYQLKRPTTASMTGNVISTFDHQTGTILTGTTAGNAETGTDYSKFSEKNPPGMKRGSRVWGLAVFRNRLYYGVWHQDSGNHAGVDSAANEVWSVQLLPGGIFTGTAKLEITLPTLQSTNPSASPLNYSNPVSSISFNAAGDMLVAERSMNGDTNNKTGGFAAHESRVLEYALFPFTSTWTLQSPTKFGLGTLNYGGRPSSAGGAAYDSFGARDWVTVDAMHYPGYPVAGDAGPAQSDRVYGIQGLPMSGGTIHNSILTDLTDSTTTADKNQMGDVEIPCAPCDGVQTPPPPAECCDKITAVPYPQNDLQLDYRTFTITNLKAPVSPICYVDISMNPTPSPIWQGGAVYVDNSSYSVAGVNTPLHFGSPYTRLPNKPSSTQTFSAVNTVKFNLGVDYTIGWSGTVTFVVHHCDGSTCTLTYGPWSALPPSTVTGPQVFDANVSQEGKLYTIGLQLKPRNLKVPIQWISFRVGDEKGQIFAASAPPVREARGRASAEAIVENSGLSQTSVLYTFAQPLQSGQASSIFNLVVRRDSNAANTPLVIWTTYDANGNALETGTINGTAQR